MKILGWPLFLLAVSTLVVLFGQPRPVALIVGGLGALTAAVDYLRDLDR